MHFVELLSLSISFDISSILLSKIEILFTLLSISFVNCKLIFLNFSFKSSALFLTEKSLALSSVIF